MPSDRFFNLSKEKQNRILKATADELMKVSYDELSISKIAKSADIPRGSFYEYFEDKIDLVNYMLEDFKQTLINEVKNCLKANNGDVFELSCKAVEFCFNFKSGEESNTILKNIFSCVKICKSDFFDNIGVHKLKMIDTILPFIDVSCFNGDRKKLMSVLDILSTITRNDIVYIFSCEELEKDFVEEFRNKVEIIKQGALS